MVNEYRLFHDKDTNQYYLIDVYEDTIDGTVITLKVKHNGWSDTWSLPLEQVRGPQ